ncbi:MAG: TrkH family potassium uptake protein [Beutenbergiaceae bacterium]
MALKLPPILLRARDAVDDIARQSPARLTLTVFSAVIAVETALLSLPIATTSGERAPFVDAVFMATSAVCVTGLVTTDVANYWSTFGHVVIMFGIMIGGLGVMTLASILGLAVSRRMGLTTKLLAASETKSTKLGEVGSLVRAVVVTSLTLSVGLAVVFVPRFMVAGFSFGESLWQGWFMGVSVFNNAGILILDGGLAPYATDWWMCLPVIVGTFMGAIGFPVILSVWSNIRHPRRWSLHAKLTISTSVTLWVAATVLIGAFEWNNENTFESLPLHGKILASMMAGMTPRSSGFSSIDVANMSEATWLMQDALMFVGGGSASTGGGVKVTTFAVMLLAIVAEARGDRDIEAFHRRLGTGVVRLSIAVAFVGATMVGAGAMLLLILTDLHLDVILFEVISAFATCGLSTGVTPYLPDSAKYVLVALMFAGRTGTMTLAAALALRNRRRVIRLPQERPIIG